MKIKVDNCCDCGKPCMLFCPVRDNSYEYHCDECNSEEQLYEFEGRELCASCVLQLLDKVN